MCCCLPLWPIRLYTTLQRAAPVRVPCLRWRVGPEPLCLCVRPACLVATLAFLLLVPTLGLAGFLWGCLFVAVGQKYNIREVQVSPTKFITKSCCCLCLMNVRIGRHVDRIQGFIKPKGDILQLVELSRRCTILEGGRATTVDQQNARVDTSDILDEMNTESSINDLAAYERRLMVV